MDLTFEVFYGIGAAILFVGMGYGIWRVSRRNRRNDPITEEATRELYKNPERYEAKTRDELNAKLEP